MAYPLLNDQHQRGDALSVQGKLLPSVVFAFKHFKS